MKFGALLVFQAAFLGWLGLWGKRPGLLTLFAFSIGFFLYSGLATSADIVPPSLMVAYTIFALATAASFALANTAFSPVAYKLVGKNASRLEYFERSGLWKFVIGAYFALHFANLLYPNFRILELFDPPSPDIRSWFVGRFELEKEFFTRVVDYMLVLLTPFFYMTLYFLRRNLAVVIIVLFSPLYLEYVDDGYIGRGRIFFAVVVISVFVWAARPDRRRALLLAGSLLLPWFFVAFSVYASLRLGLSAGDVSIIDSMRHVFDTEFSFLLGAGLPLINSGRTTDLGSYFTWLVSLPVPAFLKSGLDLSLINYEISEIVLGSSVSDYGFYVVLSGLLAESFYIYGGHYFWLHALMLGFAMGVLSALISRDNKLVGVYAYVVAVFFFTLNRGGVASTLPLVVNGFLMFYLYLFWPLFFSSRRNKVL